MSNASAFFTRAGLLMGIWTVILPGVSFARTWTVTVDGTGDASTIQAAIDSAQAGDVIQLTPGRYFQTFDYSGKNITISGSDRLTTIIDASKSNGACATFMSGETNMAVLQHMTLTGGTGAFYKGSTYRMGGAVYIDGAEPVLRDLLIVSNSAMAQGAGYGGGVQAFGTLDIDHPTRPIIENCEFAFNEARTNGGAIGFMGPVVATVRRCNIHDNETHGGDGGGVWCITTGGAVVTDNIVKNNTAIDHGGGIYIGSGGPVRATVEIARNLVMNNTAHSGDSDDYGGGAMMLYGLDASIHHNTIIGNSALGGGRGITTGGIAMRYAGTWKVEYNIIALTQAGYAFGCDAGISPLIDHNITWRNADVSACHSSNTNNIEADPLFCDPAHDNYSVQETSPALNSFDSSAGYDPVPGCRGKYLYCTWSAIKTMYYR